MIYPASLQLEITVPRLEGFEYTRQFMDDVVRMWADTGETPKYIRVKIVSWDSGRGKKSTRGMDQEELRQRFRGLLRRGRFTVQLRTD